MDFHIKKKYRLLLSLFLISLYFIALIRTAWVSDDAAITLRTVLNFINGYGPTFNVDERVQAFTHPLWFLLISFFSLGVGNVFYATFFLSISLSLITFWLFITQIGKEKLSAIVIGILLIFSRSYVDFSTSGLENPLAHLLLVLLILFYDRYQATKSASCLSPFFLCVSCLYLTRPDLMLLILPLVVGVLIDNNQKGNAILKTLLINVTPIGVWTLFSLFYYGFPFPNTAYAKLAAGTPFIEHLHRGLEYFYDAWFSRNLAIMTLFLGVSFGIFNTKAQKKLAMGILLYCAYLIFIGGDFMRGRFLTAPLLMACIILSRIIYSRLETTAIFLLLIFIALPESEYTLLSPSTYYDKSIRANGLADERGYYYQWSGLLADSEKTFSIQKWHVSSSQRAVTVACGGLGEKGLTLGPSVHIIDVCALSDPLIAHLHLPASNAEFWRTGHLTRFLPKGYYKSIEQKENLLINPQIKKYYDSIRLITRGGLLDKNRLKEIARINLGLIKKP